MEIRQDENEYKHLRLLWTAFFITAILVIFLSFFLMTHSFDLSDNTESFLLNLIWILFVIFFCVRVAKNNKARVEKKF